MSSNLSYTVTFTLVSCAKCSVAFAISSDFEARRIADHQTFYCPHGHQNYFNAKTEAEHQRDRANHLQAEINEKDHARLVAIKKQAEAEKELQRLKNRNSHGVCSCCNRSFQNLMEHMKSEHPQEIPGNDQKRIAGGLNLDEMELSLRTYNCLKTAGIQTAFEVSQCTPDQLMRFKNFGKKSMADLTQCLSQLGMALKDR